MSRVLIALAILAWPTLTWAEPRLSGTETIAEFREWPEGIQLGFVIGWRAHGAALSVGCARPTTHGEQVAALKYDPRFLATDRLTKVMILLEIRDGCRVQEATR